MVSWLKTDKHVYSAIYCEHHSQLKCFASCTAPEGDPALGISLPYILTEWGLEGADEPLIKQEATKDSMEQKDYDYHFYIAVVTKEDD